MRTLLFLPLLISQFSWESPSYDYVTAFAFKKKSAKKAELQNTYDDKNNLQLSVIDTCQDLCNYIWNNILTNT